MWTYVQSTGELVDAAGEIVAVGYAGRRAGRNNPAMENVSKVGPLPAGTYEIGARRHGAKVGPDAMPVARLTGDMFGRSGFWIHGDNERHDASEGCIILDRPARSLVADSGDRRLRVVARIGEVGR